MSTLDITESKTLLEFLLDLLHNKDALAEFRDNPHEALQHAGLGDCTVDDIKELLPVVLEKVDAEKCAQYEDDCDDEKCYDSEPKHHDDDHHCKPVDCDDEGRPAAHCSPTDQVVAHLNYVTNNYSYDSHDTYNTTNNITKIWAGDDADIHVNNTTTNVGDGGTFVGHDNNAPIVHGDGNVVGDGNQVSGQNSTTAFGEGSAIRADHVGAGDHGAVNFGNGAISAVDTSTNDSGNTDIRDSGNDNSHGSHNTDDHTLTNSQNHTTDSHDTDSSDSGNVTSTTNEEHNALIDASHPGVDLSALDHAIA